MQASAIVRRYVYDAVASDPVVVIPVALRVTSTSNTFAGLKCDCVV